MAVKKASPLLLRAVSTLSCTTPMMNPMATACMATSLPMPKKEQAMGMSSNEPPATPEAPQAPRVAITPRNKAEAKLTSTPSVCATASEDMYKAQQSATGNGANPGAGFDPNNMGGNPGANTNQQSNNGDDNVTDVDYEEVK